MSRDGLRVFHPKLGHVLDARNGEVQVVLGEQLGLKRFPGLFGGYGEFVWLRAGDRLHVFELADLENHMEISLTP